MKNKEADQGHFGKKSKEIKRRMPPPRQYLTKLSIEFSKVARILFLPRNTPKLAFLYFSLLILYGKKMLLVMSTWC